MSSEFLQLLITQTWQIATLTIVVATVARLAAKNRPHLAYALWILVLIKCITPPLWGHSLGVFSQLQAKFTQSESAVTNIEPETNTILPDASAIALSVPIIESTSAEDRPLEFFEHDELDAVLEFEAQSEVGSFEYNDTASAYNETPSAIAAPNVNSKDLTANYAHYRSVLIAAIFIGAILTLLIMVFRCLRCLRLIHRQRTTEFDEPLNHRIQQLAKQLRIRRAPRIIVSNLLFGPAVLGFLRHTIVLPRCLFESMEGSNSDVVPSRLGTGEKVADRPDEGSGREPSAVDAPLHFLDPILAHELLHIRRGDLRTGTLQAIVASLWWFHPAVWFSNRWLSREAERCCDEQVIAELGCTPGQYARALLSVIECKHRLQPIPVFPGMKPVEITTQRLERIMSLKNGLKKRTPLWCWLMIAMLAFFVLPGAVAQPGDDENAPVAASTVEGPESEQTIENTRTVSKHKAQVTQRTFEGNSFWVNGDLRNKLAGEKSSWNILWEVFSPDAIPADVEALKGYYRSVGFFDVEVTGRPLFSRDRSDVNLHFTVNEGRRYKVREIRYEGNNRIASTDLQEGTVLNSGDYFDAAKVAEDVRRIRDRYAREGHDTATANPVPHFLEESAIFDLVFEIDEDPKIDSVESSPAREVTPDLCTSPHIEARFDVSDLISKLAIDEERDTVLFVVSARMYERPKSGAKSVDENMYASNVNRRDSVAGLIQTPERPLPDWIRDSADPLVHLVWEFRESVRGRILSTDLYTPWQIMKGLQGLRHDFLLKHDEKIINGLEWIQSGPMFRGEHWFERTAYGGQAHPYSVPYAFEGHINQFAAILATCDVPLDARFGTPQGPIAMGDLIRNAQMTANDKEEVIWTLQLLCKYLPPNTEWWEQHVRRRLFQQVERCHWNRLLFTSRVSFL